MTATPLSAKGGSASGDLIADNSHGPNCDAEEWTASCASVVANHLGPLCSDAMRDKAAVIPGVGVVGALPTDQIVGGMSPAR
jgi:hypothetical protein